MLKIISVDKHNISMNTNKMIDILINSRHIHMVYAKEANEVEECCVCISTE